MAKKKGALPSWDKWLDLIWSKPNRYSFESTACDLVLAGLSLFYGNQTRDCLNVWSSYLLHTSGGIIFCKPLRQCSQQRCSSGSNWEAAVRGEKEEDEEQSGGFNWLLTIIRIEARTTRTAGLGCQIATCQPDAVRNRRTHSNQC